MVGGLACERTTNRLGFQSVNTAQFGYRGPKLSNVQISQTRNMGDNLKHCPLFFIFGNTMWRELACNQGYILNQFVTGLCLNPKSCLALETDIES